MLRGFNQQQIFEDKENFENYLQVLNSCKETSQFKLFAYCLMGNHIHLLIQENTEPIEQIMKRITTRFVYCLFFIFKFFRPEYGTPEEKMRLLKHLILSHHGKPEHGAAVVPVCLEAKLLSCIDMLDSRVEIYSEATANLSPGEFSPRIYALDKQVLKHQ